MTSWHEFAQQAPEIAAFGTARFGSEVAYLGTIRADGGPRVHPVTPIVGDQLYLFMEPTSPKGKDLQRDPRYTLHCSVENSGGGEGEFYVRGRATLEHRSCCAPAGDRGSALFAGGSLHPVRAHGRFRLHEHLRRGRRV